MELTAGQLKQLWAYHNLLRARNHDRDLTRLIGFETIAVKHYLDSLVVGELVELPSPLLDVGTGAGFPGIPLKIRFPKLRITLAEPRPRRVAFLNEVINKLGLKGIEVFGHKVVSRSFHSPVSGVITRALETIDKTILRTSACLQRGGHLFFMKGPNTDAEIKEAEKRFSPDYALVDDIAYRLAKTTHQRRLVIFQRRD